MKTSQTRHLNRIKREFNDLITEKYIKGQKEHGGNLWEHPPEWYVDQAIDEVLDLTAYLFTLKENLLTYRKGLVKEILQAGYDPITKTHSPDHIFEKLMEMK
jgi:hypothetical protein